MLTVESCGGLKSDSSLDRAAILPFDNLSGDPALDRWTLPVQAALRAMAGSRIVAASEAQGILSGATSIGRGVMERSPNGLVRLSLELFDTGSHKMVRAASAEGIDAVAAATQLAKHLSPNAKPLGNRSAESLELWAQILNGGRTAAIPGECVALLEKDPTFNAAYPVCGPVFIAGAVPREQTAEAGERAYANRNALTTESQSIAGQILFQAGHHEHAIELLRAAASDFPASWNQVGYAEAVLGHKAEAMQALEYYRKLGGDEGNAVDSLGEANFILRQYGDAEKHFLDCAARFPKSRPGAVGLLKAAAMRALQGDKAKAEELAQQYFGPLRKSGQNTKPAEELWRTIILEQDREAMHKKIEQTLVTVPTRN